jgi:hypothetical protein
MEDLFTKKIEAAIKLLQSTCKNEVVVSDISTRRMVTHTSLRIVRKKVC